MAIAISVGLASPAWSHAKVVQAEPADGAVLAQPPKELRLRFSEAIEPAFTTVRLTDGAAKLPPSATPLAVTVSERTAVLGLPAALSAGRYTVHWATVGPDGHRVQGDVHFVVK